MGGWEWGRVGALSLCCSGCGEARRGCSHCLPLGNDSDSPKCNQLVGQRGGFLGGTE